MSPPTTEGSAWAKELGHTGEVQWGRGSPAAWLSHNMVHNSRGFVYFIHCGYLQRLENSRGVLNKYLLNDRMTLWGSYWPSITTLWGFEGTILNAFPDSQALASWWVTSLGWAPQYLVHLFYLSRLDWKPSYFAFRSLFYFIFGAGRNLREHLVQFPRLGYP